MPNLRESLKPLPRRKPLAWKPAGPKGVIAQEDYETSRFQKRTWRMPPK